ncbi:MAG: flagellar hook protein FlgE [Clostridiales bacterium]|jgi:flagellar hook-basal body protein|nr:flagellar hook protein FlgE [Clostridiales bacterium]
MNRAMFSGVAGMKAHQTKMDVIGNNISNVNTYGYKSQRAVFSDIYYQTLSGASAGTAARGGTNPSMVGYGSSLMGVQSQMTQSSMQNTGFGMDVAIAGEGYLQVQDADGNIFYTKAGMLSYDSNGYLVDINGNFVLGSQGENGEPGIQKIKLDNIGAVSAAKANFKTTINGKEFTLSSANATADANVSFTFASSEALPIGQDAQAIISGGSINILFNAKSEFKDMAAVNKAINDAITEANGGVAHKAGDFTLECEPEFTGPLTGAQLAGINFGYDKGSITFPSEGIFGGFKFSSVGNDFSLADGSGLNFTLTRTGTGDTEQFEITATSTIGNKTYSAVITASQMGTAGSVVLKNGTSTTDTITLTFPSYNNVIQSGESPSWAGSTMLNTPLQKSEFSNGNVLGGLRLDSVADADYPVTITAFSYTPGAAGAAGNYTLTYTSGAGPTTITIPDTELGKTYTDGNGISVTMPSKAKLWSTATTVNFTTANNNAQIAANNITNSAPSKDLGLGNIGFTLSGGTSGGAITLDELTSINIGTDGSVSVYHPDKGLVIAGKIALATFANPNGLQQEGNNYFSSSQNSGEAILAEPGTNGTGALKSSSLEMSNVDLSNEFAEMITCQRGFQANSRVITVSDTMLEELINLKR